MPQLGTTNLDNDVHYNDDDVDDDDQVDAGVANYVYDCVYELQFNKFSLAQWAVLSPPFAAGRCLIRNLFKELYTCVRVCEIKSNEIANKQVL